MLLAGATTPGIPPQRSMGSTLEEPNCKSTSRRHGRAQRITRLGPLTLGASDTSGVRTGVRSYSERMRGAGDQLSIGERVAFYRARRGLTQGQVAAMVSRSEDWLSKIERGERDLRKLDMIVALAAALRRCGSASVTCLGSRSSWRTKTIPEVTTPPP